jgi:hypothetical protein
MNLLRTMTTLMASLCATPLIAFGAPNQTVLDQLTAAANNACLNGSEFTLKADAGGNVTLENITKPGAAGKLNVDARKGKGAVLYFNEQIKERIDEKVMTCMQHYTDQIFDYILKNSAPKVSTRRVEGNSADSHAGDPPGDGPDVKSCAYAHVGDGWSIVKGSGSIFPDSVSNGDLAQTTAEETPDHYCGTFHMRRNDRGKC